MVARRFLDPFASRPRDERDGGKDANASCRVTRSSALSRSGPPGEVSLACWPPLPSAQCSSCVAWRRGFTASSFLGCFCLIFYYARFSQRTWACIMPDLSVYVRVSSLYRPAKSKERTARVGFCFTLLVWNLLRLMSLRTSLGKPKLVGVEKGRVTTSLYICLASQQWIS